MPEGEAPQQEGESAGQGDGPGGLEPGGKTEADFFFGPFPEGLVIDRGVVLLHVREVAVEGVEDGAVAGEGGGEKQAGGMEDDAGVFDGGVAQMAEAVEAVGDDGIHGAVQEGVEGGIIIGEAVEGDRQIERVGEALHGEVLDGAVQDGDAGLLEIHEGADAAAAPGEDLQPAGQGGFPVEGELFFAFGGDGHIGHEVDLPRGEAVEAFGPGAPDILDRPVFLLGDLVEQIHEDAGGPAVFGPADLGEILVQADAERKVGDGRACAQQGQQRQPEST
ncbi:MAG TPA: hypothetical protein PL011_09740 [Kiritimatiellia bacterium]|nr:hypothetical protein [Kiritimatiellia bacterium]